MRPQEFEEIVNKESDIDYGLCPPPITAEKGLNILIDHFLGKDWHVVMPMGKEQINTEMNYSPPTYKASETRYTGKPSGKTCTPLEGTG